VFRAAGSDSGMKRDRVMGVRHIEFENQISDILCEDKANKKHLKLWYRRA
jgi:hypothetical protein